MRSCQENPNQRPKCPGNRKHTVQINDLRPPSPQHDHELEHPLKRRAAIPHSCLATPIPPTITGWVCIRLYYAQITICGDHSDMRNVPQQLHKIHTTSDRSSCSKTRIKPIRTNQQPLLQTNLQCDYSSPPWARRTFSTIPSPPNEAKNVRDRPLPTEGERASCDCPLSTVGDNKSCDCPLFPSGERARVRGFSFQCLARAQKRSNSCEGSAP